MEPQIALLKERFSIEKWVEVKNSPYFRPKPETGGLWTSTCTPEGGDWIRWCQGKSPDWIKGIAHLFTIKPTVRIYTINSLDDLKACPCQKTDTRTIYGRFETRIDFEKMAEFYDGIHLTEEGQWKTRMSEPNLYGWDCESTLWLRPTAFAGILIIPIVKSWLGETHYGENQKEETQFVK